MGCGRDGSPSVARRLAKACGACEGADRSEIKTRVALAKLQATAGFLDAASPQQAAAFENGCAQIAVASPRRRLQAAQLVPAAEIERS
jgi:hypothetical protein